MRSEDLSNVYSCNILNLWNEIAVVARHYEIILERCKNDPMGTGPASNRTHRVPCSCLSALPKKQRALLVLSLRASPLEQSPCASNCPFSVMNTYLNNIPDPFGSGLEIGIASGKFAQGRLKFMRALSTRGNRVFTEQPLGKLNNLLVTFY